MTGDVSGGGAEDPVDRAELDGVLRALAEEPAPVPTGLAGRVVERVEGLATHGWHGVLEQPGGTTRVAGWVVALVARRAAAAVTGVAGATARATPGEGAGVVVVVELDARPGVPLPALADRVRSAIGSAVAELTGLPVERVDVHVADIQE